jgi:hypothetical protein
MSRTWERLASLLVAIALASGITGIGGCTAGNDVKSAASNAVKEGKKAAKSAGDEAKKAGQKAVNAAKEASSAAKKAVPSAEKAGEKAVSEAVPFVQVHERRDRGSKHPHD